MREMLQILEKQYRVPVDTEFTIQIEDPFSLQPEVRVCLLQCRPQSRLKENRVRLPERLPVPDIVFSTRRVVPDGYVADIRRVVFVPPEEYYALPTQAVRAQLGRIIGKLNATLAGEVFICLGPGRWGTSNPDLGVPIGYSDIYNTRALIEVSGAGIGSAPEPSFGTHFFQDLVEANIYPLAIFLDDRDVVFNRKFFYETPNILEKVIPGVFEGNSPSWANALRLIEVADFRPGYHLDLVMDDEQAKAVAFLKED
jgi:hypothetical protein